MWCSQGIRAIGARTSRRSLATKASPKKKLDNQPLRFSVELPKSQSISSDEIFSQLKNWSRIQNQNDHNAAVVLATPDLARRLIDDDFMSELTRVLAGPEKKTVFHLLGGAVDHIAPPVGSYQPLTGLSIMRGKLDEILPRFWEPGSGRRPNTNTGTALMFRSGRTIVTVPGANTAFQNDRDFTLVASKYDLSGPKAKVKRRMEKTAVQVRRPISDPEKPVAPDFWVPLLPLTQARAVTGSFGNIIKGVEVNGKSVPASTELEEAVEKVYKNVPSLVENGPMGIWAMVVPKNVYEKTGLLPVFNKATSTQGLIDMTANHIEDMRAQGARTYQILSGGGGWGDKKGLLSLDPQRSHFPPSEKESLDRFMGSMDASDFAPVGAYIQFFTALRATTTPTVDVSDGPSAPLDVFGVHDPEMPAHESDRIRIHDGLFGALSDKGIFTHAMGEVKKVSKLSVPNSRVCCNDVAKVDKNTWSANLAQDSTLLLMSDLFTGGEAGVAAGKGVAGEASTGDAATDGILGGTDVV